MATRGRTKFKDLSPATQTVLAVGAVAAVGGIGYMVYQNAEKRKLSNRLKNYDDTYCNDINMSLVASEIYDAFWQYAGGWMEDEQRAVDVLVTVPKACISSLADVYFRNYEKNLYEDFTNYVQGELYNQVRPLLNDRNQAKKDLLKHIVYYKLFV
jgi:glutamate mutase epsilon subunit